MLWADWNGVTYMKITVDSIGLCLPSFSHSCPTYFFKQLGLSPSWVNGFVLTWATRRVPHVEQDLLTIFEHLRSSPVFGGVHVARSLVVYVCFVYYLLSVWLFLCFSHCVVSLFSTYECECHFGIFRLSFLTLDV